MFDLNKRCFFVMSGISNELSKVMVLEFCKKFKPGSVVVLFEDSEVDLDRIKATINALQNKINVICCNVDWSMGRMDLFQSHYDDILKDLDADDFELAFIIHNEGAIATDVVSEPKNSDLWLHFVQIALNSTVGMNQAFLNTFKNTEKLIVNLTPSASIAPFQFEKLKCSAKKARDMYFRAMAASEEKVTVINYRPGFLKSFEDTVLLDPNNNNINEIIPSKSAIKARKPLVEPIDTVNKLINTLEFSKFSSGHDVEYYT